MSVSRTTKKDEYVTALTSMMTWIVVEEWAGSTPILSNSNGSTAPRQILVKTIRNSAHVTVIASGNAVRNAMARKNPAIDKIILNDAAIFNSRVRNWFLVLSFSEPNASPRMTVLHWRRKERKKKESSQIWCHVMINQMQPSICSTCNFAHRQGIDMSEISNVPRTLAWFPALPPAPTIIVR